VSLKPDLTVVEPRTAPEVLILHSRAEDAARLARELPRAGLAVDWRHIATEAEFAAALSSAVRLILADCRLEGFDAIRALRLVRQRELDIPFIVVSSAMDEDLAIGCMKEGAADYVLADQPARLGPAISRALEQHAVRESKRRAEDALRESEARYRELFENANDVVYSLDLDGTITSINRAGERIFGRRREQIIGLNVNRMIVPEHLERTQAMLEVKRLGRARTTHELDLIVPGGQRITLEISSWLVYRDGQPVAVHGIGRDITTRKAAELALKESEVRYRELFENAHDMVYTIDFDGNFTSINRAGERILGYTRDEWKGMTVWQIVPSHEADRIRERLRQRTGGGGPTTYQQEAIARDGRLVILEVSAQTICRDGRPFEILGIARDVTDRHKAEAEVRRLNAELEQRVTERTEQLAVAKREADRANLAKSEFLSRMSHELRTPLNSILGFAQLMELDPLNPEQRESVGLILAAGRHLLELINEVLDITRIEAGQLQLAPESVAVEAAVAEALDMIRPIADGRRVHLHVRPPGTACHAVADPQRLKQVLLNLLANAVKYNREGGEVWVAWDISPAAGRRVRIEVRDAGPGIVEADLPRLFQPFNRLRADRTGVEGTGLGLALTKRLVEAMGGSVGVSSREGEGSTFWIELSQTGETWPGPHDDREPPQAPLETPERSRTVLYVEGDLANVALFRRIVARWPRITLHEAMQGTTAIDMVHRQAPDLVFLAMLLPDMSGEQALARLKADPQTRGTPVVMIGGDDTAAQVGRLLAMGAHAVLPTPFDVRKLMQVVTETLREGPGRGSAPDTGHARAVSGLHPMDRAPGSG
jgi:PAS domain S-box-containing protein